MRAADKERRETKSDGLIEKDGSERKRPDRDARSVEDDAISRIRYEVRCRNGNPTREIPGNASRARTAANMRSATIEDDQKSR